MASTLHLLLLASPFLADAKVYDLQVDGGAVPDDDSAATAQKNGAAMNATIAKMQPGDKLVVPNGTYHMLGGIKAQDKHSITISFDGTVVLPKTKDGWPRSGNGNDADVLEFMEFHNMTNFTITSANANTGHNGANAGSNGQGMIEGNGATWWGIPGVGYLEIGENRPRLLRMTDSHDVLIENIYFHDPPYWTTNFDGANGLEIRNCRILAERESTDRHTAIDMTAFNTDGFDVSGSNIHIHHSTVWNQDDTFCVKDNSENVLIEHVNASGVGLTIGSISSNVRNVTFRDVYMHHTYKGIYMKFRGPGNITDVLYENIVINEAEQYPIWIGPAQQSDDKHNPCAAHPCSICWPSVPFSECNAPPNAFYKNITLRNVTINSPEGNPGVIFADSSSPMVDITFDNVVVNNPSTSKAKWGTSYMCQGVSNGIATGNTNPVPSCFKDETSSSVGIISVHSDTADYLTSNATDSTSSSAAASSLACAYLGEKDRLCSQTNFQSDGTVCDICVDTVKGLISAGAGGACGAACGACGCEPCIPFCASICASIAGGETNATAVCQEIDLC